MKKVLLVLTIAAATVAGAAHAERRSFTTDVTRTGAEGRGYSRHTEQVGTATGFSRQSALTTNSGKMASRAVDVSVDAESQSLTKSKTVTGFNGETHSSTVVRTRTDGAE